MLACPPSVPCVEFCAWGAGAEKASIAGPAPPNVLAADASASTAGAVNAVVAAGCSGTVVDVPWVKGGGAEKASAADGAATDPAGVS